MTNFRKITSILAGVLTAALLLTGCGSTASKSNTKSTSSDSKSALADGSYAVDFTTDSKMFHVNEACEGKGLLTVQDGAMTVHISLPSKNIVNLFVGTAKEAAKDGAVLLQPTTDTVYYSDGTSEEVNGFDVPVTAVEQEFDLAIIGTKGKWYDHKVKVENPEKDGTVPGTSSAGSDGQTEETGAAAADDAAAPDPKALADGDYTVAAVLEGGSGRASITSPATIHVKGGAVTADIEFSSDKYDYTIVDGVRYEPDFSSGKSMFTLPVADLSAGLSVTADTTAMSQPHEIDYTVVFDTSTLAAAD